MTTAPSDPLGFWAIADADPNRPALITPSGDTYTYGQLDERANQVANGLRALGLRRGDGGAGAGGACSVALTSATGHRVRARGTRT